MYSTVSLHPQKPAGGHGNRPLLPLIGNIGVQSKKKRYGGIRYFSTENLVFLTDARRFEAFGSGKQQFQYSQPWHVRKRKPLIAWSFCKKKFVASVIFGQVTIIYRYVPWPRHILIWNRKEVGFQKWGPKSKMCSPFFVRYIHGWVLVKFLAATIIFQGDINFGAH